MDDKTFARLAADTMKKLEAALTDIDGLEVDLAADILTLEFDDGKQYIINSHSAAKQIWAAANRNAWHFSYDDAKGKWIDTREGNELFSLIGELVSKMLGRAVKLG